MSKVSNLWAYINHLYAHINLCDLILSFIILFGECVKELDSFNVHFSLNDTFLAIEATRIKVYKVNYSLILALKLQNQ